MGKDNMFTMSQDGHLFGVGEVVESSMCTRNTVQRYF